MEVAALEKQEKGCGALTGWSWKDIEEDNLPGVYFNLPIVITAGCIERAIVSAGGPKISCHGEGLGYNPQRRSIDAGTAGEINDEELKRQAEGTGIALSRAAAEESERKGSDRLRERSVMTEAPSQTILTALPTSSDSSSITTHTYIPMTWDDSNTEVLTWTITEDVSTSTYIYTTTIPEYTYRANSTTRSSTTSGPTSSSKLSSTSQPSSTSTLPAPTCTGPMITFTLSGASADVAQGELVNIAGSAPELGIWVFEDSIPMNFSDPVWEMSVPFLAGEYTEYKYFWVSSNGTVVWTSDPNYSTVALETCGSAVQDVWR